MWLVPERAQTVRMYCGIGWKGYFHGVGECVVKGKTSVFTGIDVLEGGGLAYEVSLLHPSV